ncbi:MAG: glycosyltransferase family 2 protein [Gemmatimonadota bacterium]
MAPGTAHGAPARRVTSVVINFNGGERLLRCVEAIHLQKVALAEVLVVDSGSTDGSPERVRADFPGTRIIDLGANRGPGAARNVGLRAAATNLVLLVDHDLQLAPGCVGRLLTAYDRLRPIMLCPRIHLHPERGIVQADGAAPHFLGTMLLRHGFSAADDLPTETALVGACPSGCLLVESSGVLATGGFDELYFFYFEDLELSLRLRALGHKLVCEPTAVAFHDPGMTGLAFRGDGPYPSRRAYLTCRNRLLTMLIHYRARTWVVLLPALILYELASLSLAVARGWTLAWARAWLWQPAHLLPIVRRRRRIQKARVLHDRELLVGGQIPLAPGLVRSRPAAALVDLLSALLDAYWRMARRWIG